MTTTIPVINDTATNIPRDTDRPTLELLAVQLEAAADCARPRRLAIPAVSCNSTAQGGASNFFPYGSSMTS